jgi:4-carboxymuconolactone decarboxylase
MARIILDEQAMTDEQRAACAEAISGRRGKIPSPMIAWLRNPELARRGQQLGEVLRFQTSLESDLVELAILITARHWTAHQVWTSHKRYALQYGIDELIIETIASGMAPIFTKPRHQIVYDVSKALLEQRRLSNALYVRALAELGEPGLVELVAIIGYYCLVAMTANAFELGLPDNKAAELRDPKFMGVVDP